MYKVLNRQFITSITQLFNNILETRQFPSQSGIGVKSGCEEDPNNYRGITLQNVLAKIFASILNSRILSWAEDNNLLNESQFGFRKGRRTIDCQIILLTLIQKFKSTRNPLYSCFIDFSKAFDSLDHSLLWSKLANFGLSSRILSLLQDMYSKVNSCVRVNGNTLTFFSCNKGVRQGCNLSPLLFCLCISDLESSLLNNGVLGVKLFNLCLPLLLFADDVLLFGNSPEDLQHFHNILSSYCATWNLTVNV